MLSLRFWFCSLSAHKPLTCSLRTLLLVPSHRYTLRNRSSNLCCCCCVKPIKQNGFIFQSINPQSSSSFPTDSPLSGLEDAFLGYLFGKEGNRRCSHEEDKAASPETDDMQALLVSPSIQEKLYSEEKCFAPRQFVDTLSNHGIAQPRPSILKDLKLLIGTDTEKLKHSKNKSCWFFFF